MHVTMSCFKSLDSPIIAVFNQDPQWMCILQGPLSLTSNFPCISNINHPWPWLRREWVTFIVFSCQLSSSKSPSANSKSLKVSYLHHPLSKPILAYFLTNSPTTMLTIFNEVVLNAILMILPFPWVYLLWSSYSHCWSSPELYSVWSVMMMMKSAFVYHYM